MSVEQAQGWEEASVNDTLNAFDNGESRTPMVMSYQGFADYKESDAASTCKERDYEVATDLVIQKSWDGGDISPTLTANNAGGDQRMPDKDNFNAVVMFTTEPTPKVDEDGRTINIDESECLL